MIACHTDRMGDGFRSVWHFCYLILLNSCRKECLKCAAQQTYKIPDGWRKIAAGVVCQQKKPTLRLEKGSASRHCFLWQIMDGQDGVSSALCS